MAGRKANLVVCVREIVRPWVADEEHQGDLEPALERMGVEAVGHGLAVLTSIPGSLDHERARMTPMALLVSPAGKLLASGGVRVAATLDASRALKAATALREVVEGVLGEWAQLKANRDRWGLQDGPNDTLWRETVFLRGYHAITHSEHRVKLAERRSAAARQTRAAHQREVEAFAREHGL